MLVLTRKLGESIQIGDGVRVTVRKIGETRVQLGIEAPPEVGIARVASQAEVAAAFARGDAAKFRDECDWRATI